MSALIGAVATFLLIGLASIVVGQAVACLASGTRRELPAVASRPAPAFGLAALLVVAGLTIRLPGHATTAAIALLLLTVAAAVYLRDRSAGVGSAPGERPAIGSMARPYFDR